jgi:hypothetical protein
LARVFGLDGAHEGFADPGYASFEHVDGSRLASDEFHLSDSMRLDEVAVADFAETLPAYSHLARPLSPRAPLIATVGAQAAPTLRC